MRFNLYSTGADWQEIINQIHNQKRHERELHQEL